VKIPYGYIYETKNLINKKLYVGKRKGFFCGWYFGGGKLLRRALLKYGINNFRIRILHLAYSEIELNSLEIRTIRNYRKRFGKARMYNLSNGGEGMSGWHHSPRSKSKIKKSNTGRVHTDATKEKIRIANIGRRHSRSTRMKMSATHKRIGTGNWMLGRRLDHITIEKLSISHLGQIPWNKGKNLSLEHREKIGHAHAGIKHTTLWNSRIQNTLRTRVVRKKISDGVKASWKYRRLQHG